MMAEIFKEFILKLYMSLISLSISSYQNLMRMIIHHFKAIKHGMVFTTSMLNVW